MLERGNKTLSFVRKNISLDSELCCMHGVVLGFKILFYSTLNIINEILFLNVCDLNNSSFIKNCLLLQKTVEK